MKGKSEIVNGIVFKKSKFTVYKTEDHPSQKAALKYFIVLNLEPVERISS